jgi:predicted MFS family arabinose efflux permease
MAIITNARTGTFYGWRVVAGAFVLAVFGWGIGFYGPPVFLHAIQTTHDWPLAFVSTAVTAHFLIGALAAANLPALHRRFGIAWVTKAGAVLLAVGIFGWASATAPWQLLLATALSGLGWAAMSAAAINAIVSPWFVHARPAALSMAYNGGSVGGVVFSPLWVAAIDALGFPAAAAVIGAVAVLTLWCLADLVLSRTPEQMGVMPDGAPCGPASQPAASAAPRRDPRALWRDATFLTLAAGMTLGLFAQIGLIAHLFSLLAPVLGAQPAGWALGLATALAIGGRTAVGWLMPAGTDRRLVACASYAVQVAGSLAFMLAGGGGAPLLLAGVVLFGIGIGNATSLPPLIAQTEFARNDVPRVVALIVGVSQAGYAFAPAAFGLIRDLAPAGAGPTAVFAAAALLQALAIGAFLIGRTRENRRVG